MNSAFVLTLSFMLTVTVISFSLSETIFQDDFEKDKEGQSPAGWVGCPQVGRIDIYPPILPSFQFL